jgi:hypothetical protein
MAKWGLLRTGRTTRRIAFKAINARAETLTEKPAYPTHYLGKVHLYEFVNEPDLGGGRPRTTPPPCRRRTSRSKQLTQGRS